MAKNDNVKFWWIKLETNFFYQNAIDFLMGQKNGSDYVVLYQMLCLSTANTDGVLMNQIGDILVKYDVDKIQRDTKYFNKDTVIVALELYKKLGLIYEESNGFLKIANYNKMVDSTTFGAIRKREERSKKSGDKLGTNVPKSIELRDKILEEEKELNTLGQKLTDVDTLFNQFWLAYPKKVGKDKCIRWFKSHKVNQEFVDDLLIAIENQKQSKQWQKDKGQFIPHPYTWLNRGGWQDELDGNSGETIKNRWGEFLDD